MTLLDYLREAKAGVIPEQQRTCDDFVIGILSPRVPEQVWKDAVDMGVRLAMRQAPLQRRELKGVEVWRPLFILGWPVRTPTGAKRTKIPLPH